MKSIKEKAEELYPTRKWSAISDLANEKFIEGANYVLDAITECMPKTHSFNPNEVIDIIVNRIRELKNN